ncbi:VTT domain-containing protein [Fluoribacter gormanii]|uniref:Inner membrane protein yabI n=1 Tax=Fluoribacter gormanii TaxID=464 RepID=A0A377GJE0_9GAMM|nr:bifunctional DedA family/phosphatase PAP2 family protein [Fluoribacter gormanii]KTD01409.1 Legionella secretion system protein Y [Fluoribacter gormanii]MCW8471988.1 VTT domain-containing protein [Fluoribacter gormanii]SIR47039.1 membrane protein DedA, SNARE-associated domain [Fluoribacter gormanii]STO24891.1 Inner membrane protein yabI [Fluoribacter gormanii]
MNLFVDYVQPLTVWLQQNPHWSLFITFLISLTESLAIVGSIVPGSVTMTAIGILAGSGIMRIDLTLLAAILGAVAGDSLSYLLGYYYSDRLTEIWPFSKYPRWIQYGKDFFETHGGKSVLIGRFVGPLRSIIPVIAGILHMKQWRFFVANLLSAIGWSLLYVMPGVAIGAASHELSTESATRLFILILILLAGLWFISLFIKRIIGLLSSILKLHLHTFWLKLKNNSIFVYVHQKITPHGETNHYHTAAFVLITVFCLFFFLILLGLTVVTQYLTSVNYPAYLFLQSFNTPTLKIFFIFCTQLTSTTTIISFFIICCCWFIYRKNKTAVIYLCSIIFFSSFLALSLTYFIHSPRPPGLLIAMPGSSFPAFNLLIATALYGFILFYINNNYNLFTNMSKSIVFTVLGFSGLGALYLGDYWLSDVLASYFAGTTICLIHCLIYRKSNIPPHKNTPSLLMISLLIIGILLSSFGSTYFNFKTLSYSHTPYHKKFTLSEKTWWEQEKPTLPIYQFSRIGKRISLLNVQFSGNLDTLQSYLEKNGWKSHEDSFFTNLLLRISQKPNSVKLPLLTQLYENKAPMLIMTFRDPQSKLTLELRIWESSFNLLESNQPLWIGSVHPSNRANKQMSNQGYFPNLINPINYMFNTENPFSVKQIKLPEKMIKTTKYPTQPYLTLIKEKKTDNIY